jgi:peptidoglycan/LPS O-acetylase OafA/YrhL
MNLVYYRNLDGMRGVAALMVVVFHFFSYPISNYVHTDFYKGISEFGQHGVSMFFVLSGFVITRILIKSRSEKDYFRSFYWRRFLRIFPLYYLFLIVWYFLMPFISKDLSTPPLVEQIPFYFYLQNLHIVTGLNANGPGHYWTLAIEEHFYFIWPFVVFIVNPKYLKGIIIILIIVVIPLKYFLLIHGYSVNKLTFTRFDQILLGAYLAYLESKQALINNHIYYRKFFLGILFFILPISVLIYFGQRIIPQLKELLKYNLLGVFFFALIGLLIIEQKSNFVKLIDTFLCSKLMQYLGKISYGIYVWHVLVLIILARLLVFHIIILDLLTTLVLSVFIAHLSYFYFEAKMIKLR